jgi:hypothetical protein
MGAIAPYKHLTKELSMNRLFSTKSLIATAIALGAVVAGTAAHAGTNVTLVVGQTSSRYVQPAPMVAQLQTVQFGHDRERFDRNDRFERNDRFGRNDRFDRRDIAFGDSDRVGIPNKFDRDSRFYDARATQRHAQWGDSDRDGVPNQFDRAPNNPRRR